MKKRILAILTMLMLCLALMPGAAFADTDDKTLTVDASAQEVEGESYQTIQAAINYIYSQYKDAIVSHTYKIYDDDSALNEVEDSWYLQTKYGSNPTTYKYNVYPEGMSNWTIAVKSGTYDHFSVYEGLDGITIKAADNATVTVKTWTGDTNDEIVTTYATKNAAAYRAYTVTVATRNITIDGLDFTVGKYDSGSWCRAAITSTSGTTGTDNTGLTVKNCNFANLGEQGCGSTYLTGEIVNNMGIVVGFDSATITGCTFSRFGNAGIAIFADGRVVDDAGVFITNNTFTSCDYALNCYYGGNSGLTTVTSSDIGGTVHFTGNTVTGTSTLRSKVCVLDQGVKGSIGSVNISGNTFSYTMVVVENMDESPCTVNDVLAENTWSNGSFYVEADAYYWDNTYQGTLTVNIPDYVYYESPESDTGYWVLNVKLEDYSSSTNTEFVQALIDTANEAGSHTLSITFDNDENLVDTITALKDCIYWVSGVRKTSEPGLDKSIAKTKEDGTVATTSNATAAAGETIDFELVSTVPDTLSDSIDYSAEVKDETIIPVGTVQKDATYTLIFHDQMDDAFNLETGTFKVYIGDKEVSSSYYTVTTSDLEDDCTFEVSMDLLALYTAGIITEEDFGKTSIKVTYSATLKEGTEAGAYYNTAWVSYPDDESKPDKVEVDTYGLSIFKYDQSKASASNATDANAKANLQGAKFTLSYDKEGKDVITAELVSGQDGYIRLDGLDAGTYFLTETEAPDGFVCSSTPIEITISEGTSTHNVVYVFVANAPIPSTGGAGTRMYLIGGACLIAAAGTVFAVSRRKKED